MLSRREVFGIDFSGAADAGKWIWIAGATFRDDFLAVHDCYPASQLRSRGVARGLALAALRELISSRRDAVFGIDVPFGLPAALLDESSWPEFAVRFVGRYSDAERFKEACWARANGRELRRQTDREARTPFSPYNLRLYKQTFHGLNDVIGPLVAAGSAVAVPMQEPLDGRALLVEVCPASTLHRHDVDEPYKGRGGAPARERLVEWLVGATPMAIPAPIRAAAVRDPNGDVLDAIIAAGAAARAMKEDAEPAAAHLREGFVYL
jgi:hypothetical protein